MNDCIGKPLQKDRLLEVVRKWAKPAIHKPLVKRPEADSRPISKVPVQHQHPFDLNRAVQEFMGKEKLLFKVQAGFIENSGNRVNSIQQAVQMKEFDLICLLCAYVFEGKIFKPYLLFC